MKKEGIERKPWVRIMADCLKPNHFHLLIEEIQENGISRFMQKIGTGYTGFFNKKYERVGSLFQSVFKAVEIQRDAQLYYILVYINVINPGQEIEPRLKEQGTQDVEGMLKFVEEYPWSTHQEYLGKRDSIIVEKGIEENLFSSPEQYRDFARDILLGKKGLGAMNELFLE